MIDRAGIIEDAKADFDRLLCDYGNGCLYLVSRLIPRISEKDWTEDFRARRKAVIDAYERALAAVPPAPPAADHTPVERLRAALEMQASPTIDRGDSHGARGQKGWIVYESSLPFIAADLAADRAEIIEEFAQIFDAEVIDAQRQIDENIAYTRREGRGDQLWSESNELCRTRQRWNENAARQIRALAAVPPPSILERLRGMSEDERMSVFSEFCLHCGSDDPTCQCWNDE